MESTTIRKFTNAAGRTTEIRKLTDKYGDSMVTYCSFTKEHPMYKKYGVTDCSLHSFKSGSKFYRLKGDVFGQRFEFGSDLYDKAKTPLQQTKEFLANLFRVQKYKPTKFLERLIGAAKYIK